MAGFAGVYVITHVDQRYIDPLFWLNVLLAAGFVDGLLSSQTSTPENDLLPHRLATEAACAMEPTSV